ncbi:MAG: histidine kinase [Lewinellaceae bacterium]|nr:histidine kinase [Lewinellaceae bacterium]
MTRLALILCLFLAPAFSPGQSKEPFRLTTGDLLNADSINLLEVAGYFCDSTGKLSLDEVQERVAQFVPFSQVSPELGTRNVHWFFFRIDHTEGKDTLVRIFHSLPSFRVTVFQKDSRGITKRSMGQVNRSPRYFVGSYNMAKLTILPGEESLFYVVTDDRPWQTKERFCHLRYDLLTPGFAKVTMERELLLDFDFRAATLAFFAILSFLVVFTGLMYIQNRDLAYLRYTGYVALILLYYLARRSYIFHTPFSYINAWKVYWEILLALGIFVGYIHFIRAFLDVRPDRSPHLHQTLRIAMILLWGGLILEGLIFLLFPLHKGVQVSEWIRYGLLLGGAWVMVRVYQEGGVLSRFIVGGTLALVAGGVLVFATDRLYIHTGIKLKLHPVSYSQIGVLAETLIFALGLGYRTKLVREEKIEAEIKYLKAQMNPHFVFNSLNSIKDLIQRERLEESEQYLTKFARLLRSVLSFSERSRIRLEEELELCRDYLQLESLRFDQRFHYEITADPELMDISIPPLIFQPFLENAIWHGLMPKTGERWVVLRVFTREGKLVGQIEDNGVGRAKAAEKQRDKKTGSFGVRLARERLHHQMSQAEVLFFDKISKFGVPEGTLVELIINLKNT